MSSNPKVAAIIAIQSNRRPEMFPDWGHFPFAQDFCAGKSRLCCDWLEVTPKLADGKYFDTKLQILRLKRQQVHPQNPTYKHLLKKKLFLARLHLQFRDKFSKETHLHVLLIPTSIATQMCCYDTLGRLTSLQRTVCHLGSQGVPVLEPRRCLPTGQVKAQSTDEARNDSTYAIRKHLFKEKFALLSFVACFPALNNVMCP